MSTRTGDAAVVVVLELRAEGDPEAIGRRSFDTKRFDIDVTQRLRGQNASLNRWSTLKSI
jgi:hypothetical protein